MMISLYTIKSLTCILFKPFFRNEYLYDVLICEEMGCSELSKGVTEVMDDDSARGSRLFNKQCTDISHLRDIKLLEKV